MKKKRIFFKRLYDFKLRRGKIESFILYKNNEILYNIWGTF